ncbi:MAG: major capsid protein [Mycoplasma sp.]
MYKHYLDLITSKVVQTAISQANITEEMLGEALFPRTKTSNYKFEIQNLVAGGIISSIAQVHGLDTEAVIGSRDNFSVINLEALLIKEKMPIGELIARYVKQTTDAEAIKRLLFNDIKTLITRVETREELLKSILLNTISIPKT